MTWNKFLRYALWAGVLVTADASRKHTGLKTAWLPHLIGDTVALLLPEFYGLVAARLHLDERARSDDRALLSTLHGVMCDLVRDNPDYAQYVAPPASAYILAHPRFNIYKSEWANRQLFGFGLDSIPHAWTAFGLTRMVMDTLRVFKRRTPAGAFLAPLADQAEAHRVLVSAGVLAAASAFYEGGEYAIHRSELKAVNNDPTKIAMEWSVADTVQDLISNAVGWLLAVLTKAPG